MSKNWNISEFPSQVLEVQMHESGSEPASHTFPANQSENGTNSENESRLRSSPTPPAEAPRVSLPSPAEPPNLWGGTIWMSPAGGELKEILIHTGKSIFLCCCSFHTERFRLKHSKDAISTQEVVTDENLEAQSDLLTSEWVINLKALP